VRHSQSEPFALLLLQFPDGSSSLRHCVPFRRANARFWRARLLESEKPVTVHHLIRSSASDGSYRDSLEKATFTIENQTLTVRFAK